MVINVIMVSSWEFGMGWDYFFLWKVQNIALSFDAPYASPSQQPVELLDQDDVATHDA